MTFPFAQFLPKSNQSFDPPAAHCADVYKFGHPNMYPSGMTYLCNNFTPRSNYYAPKSFLHDGKFVWLGLQAYILSTLIGKWNRTFFEVPKEEAIRKYSRRVNAILYPNVVDVSHFERLHDLGYLPLEIRGLPEGTRVKYKIPVLTIRNTLPGYGWLANYVETDMSNGIWKCGTSASTAYEFRKVFDHFCKLSGGNSFDVNFQGHDFSYRGLTGDWDAAMSGLGHAASFMGSDTAIVADLIEYAYGGNCETEPLICSVPAGEHSCQSANILSIRAGIINTHIAPNWEALKKEFYERKPDLDPSVDEDKAIAEYGYVKYLITVLYPEGIVSVISDTFDFWAMLTEIAPRLKPEILARRKNALGLAKVVFRPDSGNPYRIILGYNVPNDDKKKDASHLPKHVQQGAIRTLMEVFGSTKNELGFDVLNPYVGLIYGDSITLERAHDICEGLYLLNICTTCWVAGIGSYTYQVVSRDTHGQAMKATHATFDVDGEEVDVNLFKDPKTDNGTKKSAHGLLFVDLVDGEYSLIEDVTLEQYQSEANQLQPVFRDSQLVKFQSFADIRTSLSNS